MTLRVGHIRYANCEPYFHGLREAGFGGEIVPGVPAELNRKLAAGELDLSPSSSFEYALHAAEYLLLPGFSISSRGPVRSVLLFSPVPLEELSGRTIHLTGESATSVNLLRILLGRFAGLSGNRFSVPAGPIEELVGRGEPALLIGDRALRSAAAAGGGVRVYDLGELWRDFTGLPFVFALWILRRQTAKERPQEVRAFIGRLRASLERSLADLEGLAETTRLDTGLSAVELVDYWRCMDYGLEEEQQEGLRLFFRLCAEEELLPSAPELRFFA